MDLNDSYFYLKNSDDLLAILLYMLYLTFREYSSLENNKEILSSSPDHSEVMYYSCFVLLFAFYIVTLNSVILWDFIKLKFKKSKNVKKR